MQTDSRVELRVGQELGEERVVKKSCRRIM